MRARLEALLGESACAAHEVLNGGTAAYSTDQEYLFFLEEGARYQPDVVVLLFFYNDLAGDTPGGLDKPRSRAAARDSSSSTSPPASR